MILVVLKYILSKKKFIILAIALYLCLYMFWHMNVFRISTNYRLKFINTLNNSFLSDQYQSDGWFLNSLKKINLLSVLSSHLHIELGHLSHSDNLDSALIFGSSENQFSSLKIAIGGGLTSAGVSNVTKDNIMSKFLLFTSFIPSFCKTASFGNFTYHFYFAYDYTDKQLKSLTYSGLFQSAFQVAIEKHCGAMPHKPSVAPVHMVMCDHTKRPAWAQNDAMLEAYLDNVDYFYRINDDTTFATAKWSEAFINTLNGYDPPNVGVAGPTHSGGNTGILTYDFVHQNHIRIFGYHYPRMFTDWWADNWVTFVYTPGRMTKLKDIKLSHTLALGQRYSVRNWKVGSNLQGRLLRDRSTLERYIRLIKKPNRDFSTEIASLRKVISYSLHGQDPKHTWGAIRNVHQAQLFFPNWTVRFYVVDQNQTINKFKVPERILKKLIYLGAEIRKVNLIKKSSTDADIQNPAAFRNLVIDDPDVDVFLIRDADSRLSELQALLVNRWLNESLNSKGGQPFHTIRDMEVHRNLTLVDGLWGARASALRKILKDYINTLPKDSRNFKKRIHYNPGLTPIFNRELQPKLSVEQQNIQMHLYDFFKTNLIKWDDDVSCSMLGKEMGEEFFIGQKVDEHELPIYMDEFGEGIISNKIKQSPSFLSPDQCWKMMNMTTNRLTTYPVEKVSSLKIINTLGKTIPPTKKS